MRLADLLLQHAPSTPRTVRRHREHRDQHPAPTGTLKTVHGEGGGGGGHFGGGHIGVGHAGPVHGDMGVPPYVDPGLTPSWWSPGRFGGVGVLLLAALLGIIAGFLAFQALTTGPAVGLLVAAALAGLDWLLLARRRR